jgi:hypothetical protein
MQKFLNNPWVKLIFSISIIASAIPTIYTDFIEGNKGNFTHYGVALVGLSYLIESTLWIMQIWNKD